MHRFKVVPVWFNLFWINKHLRGKQSFKQRSCGPYWSRVLMLLSWQGQTVSSPTGKYTAAFPSHPHVKYIYYSPINATSQECAFIPSADKDKHAQTVKCTHRKLECLVHTPRPILPSRHSSVSHCETDYFKPAETETVTHTWNSLVPLEPRPSVCVSVH